MHADELSQAHSLLVTKYYTNNPSTTNSLPHSTYAVSEVKGSMITATKDGHSITRNSSFLKKITSETEDALTDPGEVIEDSVVVTPRYPSRVNRQRPSYLNDYEPV
ncbi:hypothetical protein DPEC_G00155710 [Dallia pectoralis]|uniref:Uncharacterized protein n=1 Tax=Dallia pectoralis TaxID=75939 RepID=A0ACC2GKK5_DALPE|nr:hypothetical protein DPEC_G00155710 [Dallia pectoralis]